MSADTTVIVSDAHLERSRGAASDRSFHEFLRAVPEIGGHLILNGDVFEFWFEYRRAIPSSAFPTLALLAQLRDRGVRLTMVGGNHDRWGGPFWRDRLSAEFVAEAVELDLCGYHSYVHHGDGLVSEELGSRFLHWITRRPLTSRIFRLLHPDIGIALVQRLGPFLGTKGLDDQTVTRAAEAQATFAREFLARRRDVDLVILGHTHRPALFEVQPGRWYLNPGAWWETQNYAVVTADGPELRTFRA